MKILVEITPSDGESTTIFIYKRGNDNIYDYEFKEPDVDYEDQASGAIYNHRGDEIDLIGKVIYGRTMHRKD